MAKRPNWRLKWLQKYYDELYDRLGLLFIRRQKFIERYWDLIQRLGLVKNWEDLIRHWELDRRKKLGKRERRIYDYLRDRPDRWVSAWEIVRGTEDVDSETYDERKMMDNTRKALSRLRRRGLVQTTRKGKVRGKLRAHFVTWVARIAVEKGDKDDKDRKPIKVDLNII